MLHFLRESLEVFVIFFWRNFCLYAERLILWRGRDMVQDRRSQKVWSPKKVWGCGVQVEEGRGGQKKRCELALWVNVQGQLTKKYAGGLLSLVACMLSRFSHVWLYATLWTVARQALLSRNQNSSEFSRQEYWSGLLCPPPGDLPDPRTEPASLAPPALAGRLFSTVRPLGSPSLPRCV